MSTGKPWSRVAKRADQRSWRCALSGELRRQMLARDKAKCVFRPDVSDVRAAWFAPLAEVLAVCTAELVRGEIGLPGKTKSH